MGKIIGRIDKFQQKHSKLGFIYAVQKKYDDDNGGFQAALLTYYGFLSLFPLLLVVTSILQLLFKSHPDFQANVIHQVTKYIPVIGDQLKDSIHGNDGTGIALIIGLLLTIWGAKGIADVFRSCLDHLWHVQKVQRPGFPKNALKSLTVLGVGGFGLIAASLISGFAAGNSRSFALRLLPSLVSALLLFVVFWFIFRMGSAGSRTLSRKAILTASATAATGVQILQSAGTYLVTHQLGKLESLYGTFAIALGLLFWIYLQSRIVVYAVEVGGVIDMKLWPRSFDGNKTDADRRALAGYAKRERSIIPERVRVDFDNK